jgi:hypothetical protein
LEGLSFGITVAKASALDGDRFGRPATKPMPIAPDRK